MQTQRVVVTGIGIWSCLGTDVQSVTASLRAGRSGIGVDPERAAYGYQSTLTGIVERPVLKGLLDRRMRTGLAEEGEYAYMAARQALQMAQLDDEQLREREVGCIFGNESSAAPVIEAAEIMREKHDSALLGSGFIFRSMNSTVTMNLSTIFGLRGANFTVSAACASGSHSIGLAYLLIRQGLQDMVLCGGAQEVNKYSMATFDALGAFSKRMDEPTRASRPFDRDRDGLVPSGGAAALVVESYESAVARGADILCEIVGYGFSGNDYVNAHATSTPQGDTFEARALRRLFEGTDTWISSTKSMTGHECWMAGASEIVYSLLMMRGGFVAPNINLEHPDEEVTHLRMATQAETADVRTVLSNSFGFGGTNSALVLRRID